MDKPTSDTYRAAQRAIATRVLASPVTRFVCNMTNLQELAAGLGGDTWSFVSVPFEGHGTHIDLTVSTVAVMERSIVDLGVDGDDEGNQYLPYKVTVTCNWPSHGSTDPATSMARLKLYQEVVNLAADIQAEFGDQVLWILASTRKQREEAARKKAEQELQERVTRTIKNNRKGMRVGSIIHVTQMIESLPVGKHKAQVDGKYYELTVTEASAVLLTRLG